MKNLSARLLLMTIGFVMLAEIFIFVPSIANFRVNWINEKLNAAYLATLTLNAAKNGQVSKELETQLLNHVGAENITIKFNGQETAMINNMTLHVDANYDMRQNDAITLINDAFATLFHSKKYMIGIIGNIKKAPESDIYIVIKEKPLRYAMVDFSWRIFLLSLIISIITASLVYLTLQWIIIRPMRHISNNMLAFSDNPEQESRIIDGSNRNDEIGTAQRQLSSLQRRIHNTLRQKQHLAALGTAVAKINHDLRGILSSILLLSDRLEISKDPEVKRIAPTLLLSINKAIDLCGQTLDYVGKEITPSKPMVFSPIKVIDELKLTLPSDITVKCQIPKGLTIKFDPAQIYRILNNLIQNSIQAGAENININTLIENKWIYINIIDDGPGLPPRAKEKLFIPFEGSARKGGTGLGLAISRELLNANGGDLTLQNTNANGSVFQISLPI